MNISVWFEKRLPWCLVEFLPLKVPAPHFDLKLYILVVLCSMLKVGGIQFRKLSKNPCDKGYQILFFQVESKKKILYKAKLIFRSTISAISTMSWARILLSWEF
jgi:hypothetical protein